MQEDKKIEEYVILNDTDLDKGQEKKNWKEKLKDFLSGRYFVPIVIILITIISFSLGRVSGLQEKREPVRIINNSSANPLSASAKASDGQATSLPSLEQSAAVGASDTTSGGVVVASKNSTKYHYPWCSGAKRISPKNLISFNSIEEARASGYTPAANCKGLK